MKQEYWVVVEIFAFGDADQSVAVYGAFTSKALAESYKDQLVKAWSGLMGEEALTYDVCKVEHPEKGLKV